MSVAGRINTTRFNTIRWNDQKALVPQPALKILYNQRDVVVQWQIVPGATHYRYQVSLFPDFRTVFKDEITSNLFDQFTDNEADNKKRFWRWRPYSDAGITPIEPWSDVGSYWIDLSAPVQLSLSRNNWMLADPESADDNYLFALFPRYKVVSMNLYRIQERNRLGDLLSEFLTVKGNITLFFDQGQYIDHPQFHEMLRFHDEVRTCFLLTNKDGDRSRPISNIWKVEFMQDPSFTMLAAGRQDLMTGQLNFEEV